jgi:organic radical activating enzyme
MSKTNIIMIESVAICNAKCQYCPQGAGKVLKPKKGEEFITPEILKKALKLAQKGNQKAIYLHHRGEPLLHPKIGYVIREVREAGFLAYLSTNLIAASDSKINEIMISGINQVEIHFSGGLTILTHNQLLERVHKIRKANWLIRNNACKIEVNYALQENEDEKKVRKKLSKSEYYDENMYIRFYKPHDWTGLVDIKDFGVNPQNCEWYKTNSCAILCNGDVVICCLDQVSHSKLVNILDINEITEIHLSKREICYGCIQHDWDMDWLKEEAIEIPKYLMRKLKIDSWEIENGRNNTY